jgi:hypothetical protein
MGRTESIHENHYRNMYRIKLRKVNERQQKFVWINLEVALSVVE